VEARPFLVQAQDLLLARERHLLAMGATEKAAAEPPPKSGGAVFDFGPRGWEQPASQEAQAGAEPRPPGEKAAVEEKAAPTPSAQLVSGWSGDGASEEGASAAAAEYAASVIAAGAGGGGGGAGGGGGGAKQPVSGSIVGGGGGGGGGSGGGAVGAGSVGGGELGIFFWFQGIYIRICAPAVP